jgi:hypothetical protein
VIDEASHFVTALPVKTKSEIPGRLKELFIYWQTTHKRQIQCIRSDRGTEFLNQELKSFCSSQGIEMDTSAPGTLQQNGMAERMNRTLKELIKTLLSHAEAKETLWREALQTAVIYYNLTPVAGKPKTPYEAIFHKKPGVSALRTWGCKAFVMLQKQQATATGPRSIPGIFIGYELGSKAYRVLTV